MNKTSVGEPTFRKWVLTQIQVLTADPQLLFNNNPVDQTLSQNYHVVVLDVKLNFYEHFEGMLNKINNTIGLLHK